MPVCRAPRALLAHLALLLPALALAAALPGCERTGNAEPDSANARARHEQALPRFEGERVDTGRAGTDLFRRKRGVIFVFSAGASGAHEIASIVERLQAEAAPANFAILGVSRDRDPEDARLFARQHGFEFPVILDSSGSISRKLRLTGRDTALIIVDAEGYIRLGFSGYEPDFGVHAYEEATRRTLRLETASDAVSVAFGLRPRAPAFSVRSLEGEALDLPALKGKVVVVVFFLHACPHCHEGLRFLERLREELDRSDLAIVPISVQNEPKAVREMAERLDLDLGFYVDPGGVAAKSYAHGGAVPDTLVLDRDHRVIARHPGLEPRIEALLTMEVRAALGVKNPILLLREGYSGEASCRICHTGQHSTWSLTSHAYAFETLVEHGEARNAECLPCHAVGWGERGGFDLASSAAYLEGVQCENCHGRGGPHQSPDFAKGGFRAVCEGCHDAQHSLQFDFAERLPLVSHAANMQFADLSLEERQALIAKRDKRSRKLFEAGRFVGSEQCRSCHTREYEIWSASAHARAFETLRADGQEAKATCQRCHSTGFEQDGGFPEGGIPLSNVGCESCHGPGADHVENDRKTGTILALTDKCDSCVILQICGSCHDDVNDPSFEFEVIHKIDLIRHGFRDRQAAAE